MCSLRYARLTKKKNKHTNKQTNKLLKQPTHVCGSNRMLLKHVTAGIKCLEMHHTAVLYGGHAPHEAF